MYEDFKSDELKQLLTLTIDDLTFINKPYFDIYKISAMLGDKEIGYIQYKKPSKKDKNCLVLLISKDKKLRGDTYFPKLSVILLLLAHAITGKLVVKGEDYTASGNAFMKKYERLGYWKFIKIRKESTLTKFGIEETEKYAKKFLDIENIKWS